MAYTCFHASIQFSYYFSRFVQYTVIINDSIKLAYIIANVSNTCSILKQIAIIKARASYDVNSRCKMTSIMALDEITSFLRLKRNKFM